MSETCPRCGSKQAEKPLGLHGVLKCPVCGTCWITDLTEEQLEKIEQMKRETKSRIEAVPQYPQDQEENEYRYLSPDWLDEIAKGLTAGAKKHPGETWRVIPASEHAWRAIRHLILYLKGDRKDKHLINASMRVMMAAEMDAAENDVVDWEKLMREKGCS